MAVFRRVLFPDNLLRKVLDRPGLRNTITGHVYGRDTITLRKLKGETACERLRLPRNPSSRNRVTECLSCNPALPAAMISDVAGPETANANRKDIAWFRFLSGYKTCLLICGRPCGSR